MAPLRGIDNDAFPFAGGSSQKFSDQILTSSPDGNEVNSELVQLVEDCIRRQFAIEI